MLTHNPKNERIKRKYLIYLRQAKRQSEATVDAVAKSLARFEEDTKFRDFAAFHFEQAIAFKRHLAAQESRVTGETLSKATQHSTLAHLKRFFQWLAWQHGYRSHVEYPDAEYFNLSENDARVATAHREKEFPTMEQVKHVIGKMPARSEIERRDRALLAFTLLTGARDSAIASMRLKHVDLAAGCVYQDAREVKTKFRKTFTTYFVRVGDEIREIVEDWVTYLRQSKLWGNDDPLFPATEMVLGPTRRFEAAGLKRQPWTSGAPIRTIFRRAFEAAGVPYFKPHSLRDTLVHFAQSVCKSPEEFKAFSQNLGHESVLTTFVSYGQVASRRQGEIIHSLGETPRVDQPGADEIVRAVLRQIGRSGPEKTGGMPGDLKR